MIEHADVVDRLIAYWDGDENLDGGSRRAAQDLTAKLLRTIPAADLAAMRADPRGRRAQIERAVATQLARSEPRRNLAIRLPEGAGGGHTDHDPGSLLDLQSSPVAAPGRPAPLPLTPAGGVVQTVTGSGFNVVGSVSGPVNMHQPSGLPAAVTEGLQAPGSRVAGKSMIRLLFLSANPSDGEPLRLDHEVREIDQALRLADLGGNFEFFQKWAVRTSDLQGHLLRHRPNILHFSGHGSPHRAIFLEAEDGSSRAVEGSRLARLLAQFNQRLRLVVLNACYSEAQASAIAEHIDCVVGMSSEIMDRAAIRIAANLYQALAYGYSVKAAFELCRADIEVGEMGQDEILRLIAVRQDPDQVSFVQPRERD
jgi:hypothetical protein